MTDRSRPAARPRAVSVEHVLDQPGGGGRRQREQPAQLLQLLQGVAAGRVAVEPVGQRDRQRQHAPLRLQQHAGALVVRVDEAAQQLRQLPGLRQRLIERDAVDVQQVALDVGPSALGLAGLRGLDLRLLDASRVDFADAYFRGADLRGIDLREANLEGASIAHAQISGAYFPAQLSADEILLSMQFGTRMRYS